MSNFRRFTKIFSLLLFVLLSLTWNLTVQAQTGPGTRAGRGREQGGEMLPAAWFPLIARDASFRAPNESPTPQPTGNPGTGTPAAGTTAVTGVPGITPPGTSTPVPATTLPPEDTNTPAPDPQDTLDPATPASPEPATLTPTTTAEKTTTVPPVPTETPSPTPVDTDVPSPTPTPSPTEADTPTATATATPAPSPTNTATHTATFTPTSTATFTPTPTNTATHTPTFTATNTPTFTPTATHTPEPTGSPVCRIMPLGDSITKGHGTCSDPENQDCTGYREPLYDLLVNAGYTFDFVGSLGAEFQANHDFDTDHEGHGGETAHFIRNVIYNGFNPNIPGQNLIGKAEPHVILLHIGTNDINQGEGPTHVMGETNSLLNEIDEYESDTGREVFVILAQIINRKDLQSEYWQNVSELNDLLATMVSERIDDGDLLKLVDMEHALNYPDDLADKLHPNQSGYTKMAAVWFTALQQVWADACP